MFITISRKMREKLGLPLEGPTGLQPGDEARLIGLEAEARFIEAWSDKKFFPPGLVLVRLTPERDAEGIDAMMIYDSGKEIRIQIKSSRANASEEKVRRLYEKEKIVMVVVRPRDELEAIRAHTLMAIRRLDA